MGDQSKQVETPEEQKKRNLRQSIVEAAYLHPFEKYNRRRQALKTARTLKKNLEKKYWDLVEERDFQEENK